MKQMNGIWDPLGTGIIIFFVLSRQASVNTYLKASLVMANKFTLRACLHEGGVPQVSGVTHFGGVNRLSI